MVTWPWTNKDGQNETTVDIWEQITRRTTTTLLRCCEGSCPTRNSAAGSGCSVHRRLPSLPPPPRRPTDPRSCRTCCTETDDSRAPRTTSTCRTRPTPDRCTAETASTDGSNTPGDTEPQRSTGDLHAHTTQADRFPDHIKFPDFSARGRRQISIYCLTPWSTVVVSR